MEAATSWWIDQAWWFAPGWQFDDSLFAVGEHTRWVRRRGKEKLSVWMFWCLNDGFCRTSLDQLASIHHKNFVGEVARAGNVMSDEQKRQTQVIFEAC
jgi:hypothetical protein